MTLYRLPAGTDIAEMALFDIDTLPHVQLRSSEAAEELVAQGRFIRLPTDGDGGYILHLYVDECPPKEVAQYYQADDTLSGTFTSTKGRIGFGGVESAFQAFEPNHYVRSDVDIPPGEYAFTAYKTDIPDAVIDPALRVEKTFTETWLSHAPLIITLLAIGIGLVLAARRQLIMVLPVIVARFFSIRAVKGLPTYRALVTRREEAELDFPSIVIEMRSIPGTIPSTSAC